MEIPPNLKTLYKHWNKHTAQTLPKTNLKLPTELTWFMAERMKIWAKKNAGLNPPYTADKTLQTYKFCNIYRELDRQTIEIHSHLKNLQSDFSLWLLNIAFHRFVCNPNTVKNVGLLNYDSQNNREVYEKLLNLPKPKYGVPYVFPISVIQKSSYETREKFFCHYLPKRIPTVAKTVQNFNNTTVNSALAQILPAFGFNFKFHWTEILIDIAYQFPNLINLYEDFYIGPGAIPTAKLINPNQNPKILINICIGTKPENFPYLTFNSNPVLLSAENWEGIFCEYRKYTNLKKGQGRVRRFNP
ncbi:MAG: nucleotide kinase domain-containing protein [Patescibacteria group bacterium]